MRGLLGEASHGRPIDAGSIEMAAVETGPEVRRRKKKGLGFAAWLSIGLANLFSATHAGPRTASRLSSSRGRSSSFEDRGRAVGRRRHR